MTIDEFSKPATLERYSFLWSEARLIIAAVALFIGGKPPVLAFNPISGLYSVLSSLLTISWLISGLAALYLLYRWNHNNRELFGHKNKKDTYAFLAMTVSGINLGLTGLIGTNIGMSLTYSYPIFLLVGLIYVYSAWYLYSRWQANGQKIF